MDGLDSLAPATYGGPSGISFIQSDGTMGFFTPDGTDYYVGENGPFQFDTISGNSSTGYTLTRPDGSEETFSGSGAMLCSVASNGNTTTLSWTEYGLTITAPAGQTATFTYNTSGSAAGLVGTIADTVVGSASLTYDSIDSAEVLQEITGPSTETDSDTPVTQFDYSSTVAGLLTTMEDAAGIQPLIHTPRTILPR